MFLKEISILLPKNAKLPFKKSESYRNCISNTWFDLTENDLFHVTHAQCFCRCVYILILSYALIVCQICQVQFLHNCHIFKKLSGFILCVPYDLWNISYVGAHCSRPAFWGRKIPALIQSYHPLCMYVYNGRNLEFNPVSNERTHR